MSQSRPKLSQLKRVCPQDLAHCEGYVWHLGTKIGKGSFGEVYLGWTNDGNTEVAVKVVRKEYFKQDPKVRENLEREIRILKILRGCEYVVHLLHVQELRQFIVLVMELCDYDLDHLVKVDPFNEESTIVFLHQLAQGMKALRDQNIVHRDLKPGNILIKRHQTTSKMMIKLADFGFARHFKDEGNKAIDMTSLAGTPVFMAPEALSCVFHPGEHYDDKVDIWSIGALLYKVLVGQCGFYAQLQDIPRILKHKGDAIAFERAPNRKINYIYELPPSVNERLSESFRDKMKTLLCSMLKLDPRERMTFTEFFETVDDIIRSKIEVINVLHGTSLKIISDPTLTAEILAEKVHIQWHIPLNGQVLFSNTCSHCIVPNEIISQDQFVELLQKSGGSKGHAKLYLLSVNQLKETHLLPDLTCFTPLKYCVDDEMTIVNLITEQKFADEIVHMIGYMGSQQRKQLEGLEEVVEFTSREVELFSSGVYPSLLGEVYQALAKLSLASQWLNEDLLSLGSQEHGQLSALTATMTATVSKLKQTLDELNAFSAKPVPSITNFLNKEEISKTVASISERAKKLPKIRKDLVQSTCKEIETDCIREVTKVTQNIKTQLVRFSCALTEVWDLRARASVILERCATASNLLDKASLERSTILRSRFTGTQVQDRKAQATPPPPPGGWAHHSVGQATADPTVVDNLKREVEQLNVQLGSVTEEKTQLFVELTSLRAQKNDTVSEVESTLVPSKAANLHSDSAKQSDESVKVMENLAKQLKHFCDVANQLSPNSDASANVKPGGQSALYPNLLADYSVIPMPTDIEPYDLQKLLPMAQQLATSVSSSIPSLESAVQKSTNAAITSNSALVKIGRPSEYEKGDVVLFNSVKTLKSKSSIPALFHLQQNKPFIFMDSSSYSNFGLRPGKVPELFLARLLETPRKLKLESYPNLAKDIGEGSGDFYYVAAEPLSLKFSAQRGSTLSTSAPPRPARSPAATGHGFIRPFKLHGGTKSDKEFV